MGPVSSGSTPVSSFVFCFVFLCHYLGLGIVTRLCSFVRLIIFVFYDAPAQPRWRWRGISTARPAHSFPRLRDGAGNARADVSPRCFFRWIGEEPTHRPSVYSYEFRRALLWCQISKTPMWRQHRAFPTTSDQSELRGIPGGGAGRRNAKDRALIDPETTELETTYFINRPNPITPLRCERRREWRGLAGQLSNSVYSITNLPAALRPAMVALRGPTRSQRVSRASHTSFDTAQSINDLCSSLMVGSISGCGIPGPTGPARSASRRRTQRARIRRPRRRRKCRRGEMPREMKGLPSTMCSRQLQPRRERPLLNRRALRPRARPTAIRRRQR